ncbi:MAG: hypothetical protein HFE75_16610 [Firmicutes bacterium]|nr:hypothetical protein [Bacillota bacterium]
MGRIYKTDRCTIIKFYKNSKGEDVCKVRYPVSGGGTKTAYAKTSRFIHDKSADPKQMKAAAKTNVSAYAGSASISGWYISAGDTIYLLGRSGSNSQVAYPISGGYKTAWIKHYNVKYSANGGSNAPSAQIKTQNVNLTLAGQKPVRDGYTFQNWNTKKDGSGAKYSSGAAYKANSAVTLYAQWKINSYALTVKSKDKTMGTVSGGGTYTYGKSVTIKAVPAKGHSFSKWSDNNTSAARSVTVKKNATYTAEFAVKSYGITVKTANSTMGTVSGGGTYTYGKSITIKATPKAGYHFVKWNDGNTSASRTVTVGSNATYTATFKANDYSVTVKTANSTMGTASGGGKYSYLSKITIIANPKSGYQFTKWSDGVTSASRSVTVKGNATYTAEFKADTNTCAHAYGKWIIDREATCVMQGIRHKECTRCGFVQNEILDFAEHKFSDDWIVETAATCEADGEAYRACVVCKTFTETKSVEKLGHDFSEERIEKQPTCDEGGIAEYFCKNCGKCDVEASGTIPATGHVFPNEWKIEKAPTCDEEGLQSRKCSVCAYEESDIMEPAEHEFQETRYEPTETQAGKIIRTCKRCGYSEIGYFYDEVNSGVLEVESKYAKPGDIVTVPVKITDNPGILGFNITVKYNKDVFTPQSVTESTESGTPLQYATKGAILKGGNLVTTITDGAAGASEADGELTVRWLLNASCVNEDGELFSINFKVNEQTEAETAEILLSCENMVGESNVSVLPFIKTGEITITDAANTQLKRGDICIDGEVNEFDSVLLAKYLVGWKNIVFSAAQRKSADVYSDGKINTKDGVRLAQLIENPKIDEERMISTASVSSKERSKITVGDCIAQPGECVEVPITIGNNTGIAGFNFNLRFDHRYLTPVSIKEGDIIGSGITSNIPEDENDSQPLESLTFQWSEAENIEADGLLCTVEFKVNDGIEQGKSLPLRLNYDNADPVCYISGNSIKDSNLEIKNGRIRIGNEPVSEEKPYEITNASISLANGAMIKEFPKRGDFDVSIEFQESADSFVPANMLLATYDAKGCLIAVIPKMMDAKALMDGSYVFHVDQTEQEISTLKIFIWNPNCGMKPEAECFQLN